MSRLEESYLGSPENPGTAAIVCYITVIGWLLAYFGLYRSKPVEFAAFHLRQTLMLHIVSIIVNAYTFAALWYALPRLLTVLPVCMLSLLWLWGMIDAVNKGQHPVPLFGILAQSLFRKL